MRHKELLEFFHYKNQFRSLKETPTVSYSLKFETIHECSPASEMFGATITLIQKWQISRLDVADYLACVDRATWVPLSFTPPPFEATNEALGAGSLGRATSGIKYEHDRIHLVIEADHRVVAARPTKITGYFFQEFELRNYPFDSQVSIVI